MKPRVICLMAASVDGRTLPSRWCPKGAAGDHFERVHEELAGDAWLIGRVTGQEFAKGKPYPVSTKETFPREPWFARRDARAYGVVLDAHGRIAWGRSDIGGDPIVVVLSEMVSDAHLAGLRSEGVSYIFAGKSQLDLALTLDILNRELGVKRLLLEGGGGTNGAFLRAGLVDEFNLVLCPAVDGAKGAPSVFELHRGRSRSARAHHGDDAGEQPSAGRWCNVAEIPNPECALRSDWSVKANMAGPQAENIVVIGAGAAGLMAARTLGRAGKTVTILEARERCGGRIHPLPSAEFGYPAEGGAEFVHGEAPITHRLLREAGLSTLPLQGARWNVENGAFSRRDPSDPDTDRLHQVLTELRSDMTVAEFLQQHFAGPEYTRLRCSIVRRVEGYDAADPRRASILALRDEWMDGGRSTRIAGGYAALVHFLASECRKNGVTIRLGSAVTAIEASEGGGVVLYANGDANESDAAILTVPIPLLREIVLPPPEREKAALAANIGFGNIIKILLRFETRWWLENRKDLADLTFLLSDASIPVWWTQHPADFPVLTGWFGGPKTEAMAHFAEHELIEAGIASLADIFDLDPKQLMRNLVTARAINWANDPFARGAYSYATLEARRAQSALARPDGRPVLLSGEALYRGRDIGTVEAALASGLKTAQIILEPHYLATP